MGKHNNAERIVRTACNSCEQECGIFVHVKEGKVIRVEGDPEHPKNRGFVCSMGASSPKVVYDDNRLKFPMKREKGEWKRISWDEAIDLVSSKLLEIRTKYGAESIGVGTGNLKKETLFTRLFARSIGTPNFFSPGYL